MWRRGLVALAVVGALLLSAGPLYASYTTGGLADHACLTGAAPAADIDPVQFTLIEDQVGPGGSWLQTFRVHINPGGTVADVSELVYGDARHIDEVFAALKKDHPELRSPAQVPANIEAQISFDPSVAFVPRQITSDATRGAVVYEYYNGARRVIYDPKLAGDHKGLSAIVDLPLDRPAKIFKVLEGDVTVPVPAGTRVAYYEFEAGDDLEHVVAEIYGTDSTRAIQDFLSRTNWDPNRWPPAPLEREQRLLIPLGTSFEDDPFTPLDVQSGNPAAGKRLEAQLAERINAGIYPVRREPYGTVYHVVARDFDITAREIATLLFGDDGRYLEVAAQSGFGTLHDLSQKRPEDVRLFGRTFDVAVDYELEQFPARDPAVDASGKRTTLLLNGTTIAEWALDANQDGLLREIDLPSGYRKLLYRPHSMTVLASQIAYALVSFGGSSNPQVRRDEEGRFVSQLIWTYGPSVPRQSGFVLDYGRLVKVSIDPDKTDELIEVAMRPDARGVPEVPGVYRVLGNPFLLAIGAVAGALVVLGVYGWFARRIG